MGWSGMLRAQGQGEAAALGHALTCQRPAGPGALALGPHRTPRRSRRSSSAASLGVNVADKAGPAPLRR